MVFQPVKQNKRFDENGYNLFFPVCFAAAIAKANRNVSQLEKCKASTKQKKYFYGEFQKCMLFDISFLFCSLRLSSSLCSLQSAKKKLPIAPSLPRWLSFVRFLSLSLSLILSEFFASIHCYSLRKSSLNFHKIFNFTSHRHSFGVHHISFLCSCCFAPFLLRSFCLNFIFALVYKQLNGLKQNGQKPIWFTWNVEQRSNWCKRYSFFFFIVNEWIA